MSFTDLFAAYCSTQCATFEAYCKGMDLWHSDEAYYEREGFSVLLRHAESALNPPAVKQESYTVRC